MSDDEAKMFFAEAETPEPENLFGDGDWVDLGIVEPMSWTDVVASWKKEFPEDSKPTPQTKIWNQMWYDAKTHYTVEKIEKLSMYASFPQNYVMGASQDPLAAPVYEKVRDTIPGLEKDATCPAYPSDGVSCNTLGRPTRSNVWYMIQHLNDRHKWSREEIADWLDSLDVDLSFPTPEDVPKEPGEE